jgi:hypothetical protein
MKRADSAAIVKGGICKILRFGFLAQSANSINEIKSLSPRLNHINKQ